MKDDLLDIEADNPYVDYFFLAAHQLTDVVDMLQENEVPYQIKRPIYTQDTLIVPTAAEIALKRNSHIIQIPVGFHQKVAYLLPNYPNLKEDSGLVRKLFLSTSLDTEGLFDVLFFPEDWELKDPSIAKEILYHQGADLSAGFLQQEKQKRQQKRNQKAKQKKRKQRILICFVLLFLIAVLLSGELY